MFGTDSPSRCFDVTTLQSGRVMMSSRHRDALRVSLVSLHRLSGVRFKCVADFKRIFFNALVNCRPVVVIYSCVVENNT